MRLPWISREHHEDICALYESRIADLKDAYDPPSEVAQVVAAAANNGHFATVTRTPAPSQLADLKPKEPALPQEVEDAIKRNTYGNVRIAKRNRDFARKSLADGRSSKWIVDEIDKGEEA